MQIPVPLISVPVKVVDIFPLFTIRGDETRETKLIAPLIYYDPPRLLNQEVTVGSRGMFGEVHFGFSPCSNFNVLSLRSSHYVSLTLFPSPMC
jgi:hypothetical protein